MVTTEISEEMKAVLDQSVKKVKSFTSDEINSSSGSPHVQMGGGHNTLPQQHNFDPDNEHLTPMLPLQDTDDNDVLFDKNLLPCPKTREAILKDPIKNRTQDTDNCIGNENKSQNVGFSWFCKWISVHLAPDALCHTPTLPLTIFSIFMLLILFWGTSYSIFHDYVAPTSNIFILFALFILAFIAGRFISFLKLPPLLGMLLVGILIGNVNIFHMEGWYKTAVSTLRSTAMVVILIKAGLGLDAGALRRLSFIVIRLAFIPCLVEAAVVTCVSHFLLDLPWLWSALLGFVLAAVSPAVVVPSLLALKDQGYGEDKGISTLVIAATSIDDILAISGFGVVLSTIFSEGDVLRQIFQGPLEVFIGITSGIIWGTIAIYIPHRDEGWVVTGRSLMIGLGGMLAIFGCQLVGYSGAGPLASIIMAFVASNGWKKQGWSAAENPVANVFSTVWLIFQPVLFGLIGTAINLSTLESHAVSYGIVTLCIGLSIRLITSFLVVGGGTLNLKERIFVAVSWFPKATVQAAIGPVALDLAEKWDSEEAVIEYASLVLTIAVLSIILTAPIGAVGIFIAGPRLLGRVEDKPEPLPNAQNEDNLA